MAAWLLILLCVGIAFVFILLVLFLLGMRYLNYRENIKMAEQGLISQPKPKRNRGFLIAGWIITGLGLIGTVILWLLGALALGEGQYYPLAVGPWVLIGLVPMAIGLFLLLLYVILAPAKNKQSIEQTEPSVVEVPEEEVAEVD
jgi:nitrogen fixation-related uncharacterized protein